MNPRLYKYSEIKDFKEKIRILEKKLNVNDSEIERIDRVKKKLSKENIDLEKQIKKFESIITYAESLFSKLSIPFDEHRSVLRKRERKQ